MENIKELRIICQPDKKVDLIKFGWYTAYINRGLSIYITKFALKYNISANNITILCCIVGILSGFLFSVGDYAIMIIAAIISLLELLFDSVDGEIARYNLKINNISNPVGKWIDSLAHYIVEPSIFIGIGIGLSKLLEFNIPIYISIYIVFYYFLLLLISRDKEMFLIENKIRNEKSILKKRPFIKALFTRTNTTVRLALLSVTIVDYFQFNVLYAYRINYYSKSILNNEIRINILFVYIIFISFSYFIRTFGNVLDYQRWNGFIKS